jgi:hypothetical protein
MPGGNMTPSTGGDAFLHDLEHDVESELTLAEPSQPDEETLTLPIDQWVSSPAEVQHYQVGLGDLLGAVENLEDDH